MANQLTGGFDAVVQIALRQLDGLLATLHVNGASETAALRTLHSARFRVGEPRRPFPDLLGLADWVHRVRDDEPPQDGRDLRDRLVTTAPPGVTNRLREAFEGLVLDTIEEPAAVIRGIVEAQVSSVTLSIPQGSTSEITTRARVRAHYRPRPDTTPLPSPIHGELHATFDVRVLNTPAGRRLDIRPSADDDKIRFVGAPGSGLDAVEASRLSSEARKLLRTELALPPVDLPDDLPFDAFTGVGSGSQRAIALPLQLSDAPAPPGAIQHMTRSAVGPSGFALGISDDFVRRLIDIEAIREAIKRQRINIRFTTIFGGGFTITYRLRFSEGPSLTFKNGHFEISGRIEVETGTPGFPDGFVSFSQDLVLFVDAGSQVVTLAAAGEPDVDESWFIPHGRAVRTVKTEVRNAIENNQSTVRDVFANARQTFQSGLRTFDHTANPRFVAIDIIPDGIVARGDIASAPRPVPVVDVRETSDGTHFTAFHSWVPGGRIDRLVWSWVEYPGGPTMFGGVQRTAVEQHRFLLPKPAGITTRSQICLRVEGALLSSGGVAIPVAGGTTCLAPDPGTVLALPAWFEPINVPVWQPDIAADLRVRDAVAAHVSVGTIGTVPAGPGHNTLVYFADWTQAGPLDELGRALAAIKRPLRSLALIVIAPTGAFDERRREIEAKLASIPEPYATHLHVTEDDEGGWSRTFNVSRAPGTFLLDARRRFVWRHDGTPDGRTLSTALDRFASAAPPLRHMPLRLAVKPGDLAPDGTFDTAHGDTTALHRLRGRRVILTFWQSWSTPSLRELRRMQEDYERLRAEGTTILGLHGGRVEEIDRVRRTHGITFPLVQDAQQQIAVRYGVRCWPTTVTLNEAGRVEEIRPGGPQKSVC